MKNCKRYRYRIYLGSFIPIIFFPYCTWLKKFHLFGLFIQCCESGSGWIQNFFVVDPDQEFLPWSGSLKSRSRILNKLFRIHNTALNKEDNRHTNLTSSEPWERSCQLVWWWGPVTRYHSHFVIKFNTKIIPKSPVQSVVRSQNYLSPALVIFCQLKLYCNSTVVGTVRNTSQWRVFFILGS